MSVSLEERVAILEAEITKIKNKVESSTITTKPWWEKITGTFADRPDYDKAMQLGKQYRESQRKTSARSHGSTFLNRPPQHLRSRWNQSTASSQSISRC